MIRFPPLGQEELRRIHDATLGILEHSGVRFTSQEAQRIFRDSGMQVDSDGVVLFPPWRVEEAIRKVPRRFTREPLHPSYPLVEYGNHGLSFTSGSTVLYVLDAESHKPRAATIADTVRYIRLVDALPGFSCANGGFWSREIPPSIFHARYFELMVNNTAKPIPAGDVLTQKIADDLIRLATIVLGGREEIRRKKTFSLAACPASKCTWGENVLAFIEGAKVGMPLKIMPMPFAGSTHPVTLAGLLAQTNAEIMSCVVLIQLISPGAPVFYAPYPGILDMSTATHCFGAPETGLVAAAFAQIAAWNRIPSSITVGTTDAKIPDAQASCEKMMTALPPALAGADEIGLFGGLVGMADAISFEQLAIDDEIAGAVRRIAGGIDVSEDRLAVAAITDVPFGGNFLEHEHTLKYFREEQTRAVLADRGTRESWEKTGSKTILTRASERVRGILREHHAPPLSRDTRRELEKEIRAIYVREGERYEPLQQE
jgi:trimethylamine--corrinoid protein Co-methyltransferase